MTQRFDLAIVGGGPAGSAAAWQAAQTGAQVVVLDKAQFPR
ncbi:MAG TPA: FAD-dependent oxidoreductase, partial [Mycobacterium sp.]|nr:FAD-dependent oxidoreductase [Mycobacterium sp.]